VSIPDLEVSGMIQLSQGLNGYGLTAQRV